MIRRVVAYIIALAAILSLCVFAFTGTTLWTPLDDGDVGRGMLLVILHGFALMLGLSQLSQDTGL